MNKLGFQDFLRHIWRNLFVAFLLAIICILVSCMYSIYSYEYGRYKPIEKIGIKNGYYVGGDNTDLLNLSFEEELAKLEGIEDIYYINNVSMSIDDKYPCVLAYESWVWENWEARLKSGTWFSEYNKNDRCIQIVISSNFGDYKPGDELVAVADNKMIRCVVKGIMQPGAEVLCSESYTADDQTYNSFYSNMEGEGGVVLMQQEAADDLELMCLQGSSWSLIKYEEELSDEKVLANQKRLVYLTAAMGLPYDSFVENSKDYLYEKIAVYIPMIVSGIVLAMIALLTVAFINVKTGSRNYSIFYLVGANRKECFKIASGNAIGTILLSAMFFLAGEQLVARYAKKANIVFNLNMGSKLLALGLYIVLGIFMIVCMKLAMKKNSPMEVLREHKI
mgnify:CR=1 FL=1